MSAAAQARSAYEQALRAAEAEQERREAEARAEAKRKRAQHEAKFQAALPILNEWFPGVDWTWDVDGDYDLDTIVWDASEAWPPSFRLKIETYKGVQIKVGDYRPDSSMPGYSYFSGGEVKSAADIGRYLAGKNS